MWVLNFSVMAKQRFGVNDAYRGTVGTVIGYEWRGKWCLRARPLHVRNPRTAKQQSNRQLFKQMVDLASHMKFALRKGLRGVSLGMHVTECNLFVKRNKECFSLDAEGRVVVDWERLIVSEGEVAVPGFTGTALMDTPLSQPQAAASSPNLGEQLNGKQSILGEQLDIAGRYLGSSPKLGEGDRRGAVVEGCVEIPFEWDGGSGDDEVYVYAYCPEVKEGVLSASAWRRSGCVQLTLPERWQGKTVHFYGFAVDFEGNASGTVYIGQLQPEEVLSDWHNICSNDYVTTEKNIQSWQTRKNNRTTSNSTSTPTWPREPTVTSSLSVTIPPRLSSTSPRCSPASRVPRYASALS